MELEGHHDGREDAKTARDRALGAIVGAKDFSTQRSLWKAALKYNLRDREARDRREGLRASLLAVGGGA